MLTLSRLKEIFARHDLAPLKRLGQNYLVDSNIKDKIIAEIAPSKDDVILEIGPGLGALTIDLAASGAVVYAVEKDRKAVRILRGMAGESFPGLNLIEGDILEFDLGQIAGAKRIKVVGNLPYCITTPIMELIIENAPRISAAIVMVQKEFASRIMAAPGSKDYGSLSCFVQYHLRPSCVHTIKRTSFFPAPEVDSSLIRLDVPEHPAVKVIDERLFFKVIRSAFNQRRKTIVNSLSRELALDLPKDSLAATLSAIGIDPGARPETLGLAEFARIANAVG